ncbi:hypothetical protein GCM10020331_003760 [Ectobacillus funiculus]
MTVKKGILRLFSDNWGFFLIVGVDHVNVSSKLGGISLLIAALTWALMSVLVKRVPNDYSQIVVTTYSIFGSPNRVNPFCFAAVTCNYYLSTDSPDYLGRTLVFGHRLNGRWISTLESWITTA